MNVAKKGSAGDLVHAVRRIARIGRVLVVASLLSRPVFAQTAKLLTFENMAANWTNGHGGLQWTNFSQLDAANYSNNPSGYYYGMVSATHVALNACAHPAQIARTNGFFILTSAYLTGAWRDQLRVRVQGFARGTLIYDSTNLVNATRPSLVHFNNSPVNLVIFSSFGGVNHGLPFPGFGTNFVMDNLKVSLPFTPTNALLGLTLTATNAMLFSWLDPSGVLRLYENPVLGANTWVAITNVPDFRNGTNRMLLPIQSGTRFYRLQPWRRPAWQRVGWAKRSNGFAASLIQCMSAEHFSFHR